MPLLEMLAASLIAAAGIYIVQFLHPTDGE
jgi:hypothetical protein